LVSLRWPDGFRCPHCCQGSVSPRERLLLFAVELIWDRRVDIEPEAIDSKRHSLNAGNTRRGANLSISQHSISGAIPVPASPQGGRGTGPWWHLGGAHGTDSLSIEPLWKGGPINRSKLTGGEAGGGPMGSGSPLWPNAATAPPAASPKSGGLLIISTLGYPRERSLVRSRSQLPPRGEGDWAVVALGEPMGRIL
jgi:hypothetical protein